jgi:hypothetical protein
MLDKKMTFFRCRVEQTAKLGVVEKRCHKGKRTHIAATIPPQPIAELWL